MLEWLAEHWLQAVGVVLSGGALFFAWRGWDRSRRRVTIELRHLREEKKGRGELRGMQLTLPVIVWARRNDAYIKATFLVAGKEKVIGRDASNNASEARLRVGEGAHRYWALTDVRHLPADKPWRVCWQDSEGRLHCPRDARLTRDDIVRLTTGRTRAERAADSESS